MRSNQVVDIPPLALLRDNYYILSTFGGDWGIQKSLNLGKKKEVGILWGNLCELYE